MTNSLYISIAELQQFATSLRGQFEQVSSTGGSNLCQLTRQHAELETMINGLLPVIDDLTASKDRIWLLITQLVEQKQPHQPIRAPTPPTYASVVTGSVPHTTDGINEIVGADLSWQSEMFKIAEALAIKFETSNNELNASIYMNKSLKAKVKCTVAPIGDSRKWSSWRPIPLKIDSFSKAVHKFLWNHRNTYTPGKDCIHIDVDDGGLMQYPLYIIHAMFPREQVVVWSMFKGIEFEQWTFPLIKECFTRNNAAPEALKQLALDMFLRIALHYK